MANTPRYYPPGLPRTDPLVRAYDLIYGLQAQIVGTAAGNNNAANTTPDPVAVGPHSARFGSNATIYIESDRQNAIYVNNGSGWSLAEAWWEGSYESRYGDLGKNDVGAFWIETSRSNINAYPPWLVFRWNGNNWMYLEGQIRLNQNQLATLFGTLGTPDVGLQINVQDYWHQLQWQGNNTTWGPNDDKRAGEGPIFREVDPSPAQGWHLYDGNNVNYLNADGSLGNINLPDLISSNNAGAYVKAGSPNSGPNNGTAPSGNITATFTGDSLTPAGILSTPLFLGQPLTPSGTVSTPTFTGSAMATHQHELPLTVNGNTIIWANATGGGNNGWGTGSSRNTAGAVIGSTASGSFLDALDSPVSAGIPVGSISTPVFTGNNVTPTGNISTPLFYGVPVTPTGNVTANLAGVSAGEPRNIVRRPWFRQ
jgi:hypothetical protein